MKEHLSKRNKKEDRSPEDNSHSLTVREMSVLQMVAAGYSNSKIADELSISPNTVKSHIYNAYKKIKAPGRLQAALWTIKNLWGRVLPPVLTYSFETGSLSDTIFLPASHRNTTKNHTNHLLAIK